MPEIGFKITTDFALPSGEAGEYSYWVWDITQTATAANAASFGDAVGTSLGAATAFKALFPSGIVVGPPGVEEVDLDTGRVVTTATGASNWVPTGPGAETMPPQLAIVVSLLTALAGGRNRGRLYLPGPTNAAIDLTGRLVQANCTTIVNAWGAAFTAGTTAVPTLVPVVYSRMNRSVQPITRLSVGNVIDTQRRRRDKLLEIRSFAAV